MSKKGQRDFFPRKISTSFGRFEFRSGTSDIPKKGILQKDFAFMRAIPYARIRARIYKRAHVKIRRARCAHARAVTAVMYNIINLT